VTGLVGTIVAVIHGVDRCSEIDDREARRMAVRLLAAQHELDEDALWMRVETRRMSRART
jgi:hypothetical protein